MDRLDGKVAVVTGVGPGIGSAIAAAFAREGADLILVDLEGTDAVEVARGQAERQGVTAVVVRGDVSQQDTWDRIAEVGRLRFGGVDVLVNSAGRGHRGTVLELDEADWARILGVNLTSVALGCRAVLPQMIEAGGGAVVNVSSANASIANPRLAAYAAAKGGVEALTRNIALDHGRQGIRANAIAPGAILTTAAADDLDDDEAASTRDNYLTGSWGAPEDIANAAVYLASDEAAFVTGAVLAVDGGLTVQTPEAAVRKSFRAGWREDTVRIIPAEIDGS